MEADQIRALIETGQIREALEAMRSGGWPIASQFLAQFNQNAHAKLSGVISFEEFFRINNQVTFSALETLKTPPQGASAPQSKLTETPSQGAEAPRRPDYWKPDEMAKPLPQRPKKDKIKVFMSYSHKDEALKEELDAQLSILKRLNKIDVWNDRQIIAGEGWDDEIFQEMTDADIILMLISANFISSKFIWEKEVRYALERREKEGIAVVPIIMRPIGDWRDLPIARLQALPKDGKPVSTYQPSPDTALAEIATSLRRLVERLTN